MANRQKRLEREQATLERIAREQQALRQAKQQRKIRRKLKAAQDFAREALCQSKTLKRVWEPFIERCLRCAALRQYLPEALEVLKSNEHRLVKPLVEWRPPAGLRRQAVAADLLRHAFVRYEMPEFLLRDVLAQRDSALGTSTATVFFHVAEGTNLRHFKDWALRLSQKEAHWFLKAPAHLDWVAAVAWAEAYQLSQDRNKALMLTDLHKRFFQHQQIDRWRQFLRFAVQHPDVNKKTLTEVAEFAQHQWGRPYVLKVARHTEIEVEGLFPNLPLQALTLKGVQRRMAEQAQHLEFWKKNYRFRAFPEGPLPSGDIDHAGQHYEIRALTTLDALVREGRAMKHCVGTYHYLCKKGESFIYSVLCQTDQSRTERVGTIEIRLRQNHFDLLQFKAPCNERPSQKAFGAVQKWIDQSGVPVTWDGEDW